jgi:trk system potassium uptake protein TrkA
MRIIMVGGDHTVYFLSRQFTRRRDHVTIINRDRARCEELARQTQATIVFGDGTDLGRLEEAGARKADVVLALTAHDEDNLIICQAAQRKFGVPRTIALANDPDNEDIFRRLGVSTTVSPTRILGSLIEQETDYDNITQLMPVARGKIHVTDVRLDPQSPGVGKTLAELDLAEKTLVACIIRNDEAIVPRGSTLLQAHDHLVMISQPENELHDLEILCGHTEMN